MADHSNAAQQRLIQLILALFGDVVNGYLPSQLMSMTGASASATTRDLANLVTAGLAEFDEETRHYRLTGRLPNQAVKVYAALGRAETRLAETKAAIHRNNNY